MNRRGQGGQRFYLIEVGHKMKVDAMNRAEAS